MQFVKAKTYLPEKHSGRFLIEEKLDGLRLCMKKDSAFMRDRVNVWAKLPEQIKAQAIDEYVDGELYIPNSTASEALKKENQPNLLFCAFHLPEQKLYPHEHLEQLKHIGFITPKVFPYSYVPDPSLIMLEDNCTGEGWILKQRLRYPVWYKYKREETLDLIVTALTAGKGKFKNMVGAIVCSAMHNGELKEVANVSGMDDETRKAISENDIGRIVEIKYQEIATKGRLRHPRFVRWRDDKQTPDNLPLTK